MYTKTSWVARVGTALNRFLKTNESAGSVELTNDPTGVTTAGTPFTVANMNKIEQGIYDAHVGLDNNGLIDNTRINQDVRTTASPAFANATIAGHNIDSELDTLNGRVNQGVKTTDSPLFQALVYKSVLLYLPNITYGNVLTMFTSGTVTASRTSAGSSTVSGPVETIDWSSLNNVNSENGIESVSLYADMSVTKDNFSTYTVEVLIDGVSEYTRTASNDDTFLVYEILPMTFLQSHTIQIKVTINFSSSGGTGTRTATARVTGRINRGFDAFESMFI